jgi:hypothetical protein
MQGVNNVVNHVIEDWAAWLINVWTQLVSNLEEYQKWYKENADEHCNDQFNFKVEDQVWLQW